MRLTQQECNTGHDDDESDEADSRAVAQHSPRLRFTISKGVTGADGDVDLDEGTQNWTSRVRHGHRDLVLSGLQLHQRVQHSVGV